jgi:hypothetical protein
MLATAAVYKNITNNKFEFKYARAFNNELLI